MEQQWKSHRMQGHHGCSWRCPQQHNKDHHCSTPWNSINQDESFFVGVLLTMQLQAFWGRAFWSRIISFFVLSNFQRWTLLCVFWASVFDESTPVDGENSGNNPFFFSSPFFSFLDEKDEKRMKKRQKPVIKYFQYATVSLVTDSGTNSWTRLKAFFACFLLQPAVQRPTTHTLCSRRVCLSIDTSAMLFTKCRAQKHLAQLGQHQI